MPPERTVRPTTTPLRVAEAEARFWRWRYFEDALAASRAEADRLRVIVMRQWAALHGHVCACEEPDGAGCDWPVPIPHTMDELRAVLEAPDAA